MIEKLKKYTKRSYNIEENANSVANQLSTYFREEHGYSLSSSEFNFFKRGFKDGVNEENKRILNLTKEWIEEYFPIGDSKSTLKTFEDVKNSFINYIESHD